MARVIKSVTYSESIDRALSLTYSAIERNKQAKASSSIDVGWLGRDLNVGLNEDEWEIYEQKIKEDGFDITHRTNSHGLILARIIKWKPDKLILLRLRLFGIAIIIHRI